jgi:hypothetical protein
MARPISSALTTVPALGFEHTSNAADLAHHVGRGNGNIEVQPSALDLGQGFVVVSDHIRPGVAGIGGAVALGEDEHAHGLAQSVRQDDHVAHRLIRLARVEAHAHVDFNGGVEFRVRSFLDQFDRFCRRVILVLVPLRRGGQIFLTVFSHEFSFVVQTGRDAALPPG